MKKKRKSPKTLRQSRKFGILKNMDGFVFTSAGTLTIGGGLVSNDCVTFSFPYDGGLQVGDYITISGHQHTGRSNRVDHTKVHVARRRLAKGKPKPVVYEIESATASTLTIRDSNGLYKVTTYA